MLLVRGDEAAARMKRVVAHGPSTYLAACLASILALDLDQVPPGRSLTAEPLDDWLSQRGLVAWVYAADQLDPDIHAEGASIETYRLRPRLLLPTVWKDADLVSDPRPEIDAVDELHLEGLERVSQAALILADVVELAVHAARESERIAEEATLYLRPAA